MIPAREAPKRPLIPARAGIGFIRFLLVFETLRQSAGYQALIATYRGIHP